MRTPPLLREGCEIPGYQLAAEPGPTPPPRLVECGLCRVGGHGRAADITPFGPQAPS